MYNELSYPEIVKTCIDRLSSALLEFMKSAYDDNEEFPTLEECTTSVEETFGELICNSWLSSKLNDDDDIDSLIYSVFNDKKNYILILKFSAKATVIHSKNYLDGRKR